MGKKRTLRKSQERCESPTGRNINIRNRKLKRDILGGIQGRPGSRLDNFLDNEGSEKWDFYGQFSNSQTRMPLEVSVKYALFPQLFSLDAFL